MVLVDFSVAPVGDLVGLAVPLDQGVALLILEDHQGLPEGGAVDAQPSDIAASPRSFIPDMAQTPEVSALEETLPEVFDTPLHLGLVLGMANPCRVGDDNEALGGILGIPG